MGTTWICMHAVPQASKKMLWSLWRSLFLGIVFYYFAGAQKNKWRVSCTWEAVVAKTSRASLCCFLSPRFFLNAFNGSAEAVKVSLARRGEIKKSVVKELCSSAVYKPVHAVILFFIHLSCILEGLKSCQNVSINVLFLLYINTAATFYWDKMKQINSIFFFSPRRIIIAFETEAFYLIKVSIYPDRLHLFVFQVFGCFFFFFVFEEFAQTLKNVGELLKFAPLTCRFQTHTHTYSCQGATSGPSCLFPGAFSTSAHQPSSLKCGLCLILMLAAVSFLHFSPFLFQTFWDWLTCGRQSKHSSPLLFAFSFIQQPKGEKKSISHALCGSVSLLVTNVQVYSRPLEDHEAELWSVTSAQWSSCHMNMKKLIGCESASVIFPPADLESWTRWKEQVFL